MRCDLWRQRRLRASHSHSWQLTERAMINRAIVRKAATATDTDWGHWGNSYRYRYMATIEDSLAARSELLLFLLLLRLLCPFSASLRFLIAIKSVAGSHLQDLSTVRASSGFFCSYRESINGGKRIDRVRFTLWLKSVQRVAVCPTQQQQIVTWNWTRIGSGKRLTPRGNTPKTVQAWHVTE